MQYVQHKQCRMFTNNLNDHASQMSDWQGVTRVHVWKVCALGRSLPTSMSTSLSSNRAMRESVFTILNRLSTGCTAQLHNSRKPLLTDTVMKITGSFTCQTNFGETAETTTTVLTSRTLSSTRWGSPSQLASFSERVSVEAISFVATSHMF